MKEICIKKLIYCTIVIISLLICGWSFNTINAEQPGQPPQYPPQAIKKLEIVKIEGGLGFVVTIYNAGNVDITDISLDCYAVDVSNDIFLSTHYDIEILEENEERDIHVYVCDDILPEFLNPIEVVFIVTSPSITPIENKVFCGIFGPIVNIYGIFFNYDGSEGYTLFAPCLGRYTYLLNNEGEIVKEWVSEDTVWMGTGVYLLENGNLIRAERDMSNLNTCPIAGATGSVTMFNWDGDIIWSYDHCGNGYSIHHDLEPLPNGNILMIASERMSKQEAIQAGLDTKIWNGINMWMDYIIEVNPITNQIVWQWHSKDHLIQDYDPIMDNFGVVSDHPELIDINIERIFPGGYDFLHTNSIEYIEEFNQILMSCRHLNEILVIDHSTTTLEASGHSGGNSGRGGDLLYRWGNPNNYKIWGERQLFHQHDARVIPDGYPGEGHFTIFNNGYDKIDHLYTTVIEIVPPVDEYGNYEWVHGTPYGPAEPIWVWGNEENEVFFSRIRSGAQRLANGNTMICAGIPEDSRIFEVNTDREVVWQYPLLFPIPVFENFQNIFKMQHYPSDYPGIGEFQDDAVPLYTQIEYLTQFVLNPSYINPLYYSSQNYPPLSPKYINPENCSTAIQITTNLSWDVYDPDGDDITCDVYFGITNPPPLVANNVSNYTYNPGILNPLTTYYWRIVARDNHGESTAGPIWEFSTD
jgi:hypothetical protein